MSSTTDMAAGVANQGTERSPMASYAAVLGETEVPQGGSFARTQKPLSGVFDPGGIYDSVTNLTKLSDRPIVGVVLLSATGAAVPGVDFGFGHDGTRGYDIAWFGPALQSADAKIIFGPRPEDAPAEDAAGDDSNVDDVVDALKEDWTERDDGTLPGETPRSRYPLLQEQPRQSSPLVRFGVVAGGLVLVWIGGRWIWRRIKGRRR